MDAILYWGIDVITFIQQIRTDFLDSFFFTASSFGNDYLYLMLMPLLYWCFDKKISTRLIFLFTVSAWLNSQAKDLFNQPRPYHLNNSLKIGHTTGPGLPSGHAQNSLLFWTYLSLQIKKWWFSAASVLIILTIALSRMYLGLHFPTDILGGWLIAIALLLIFYGLSDNIEELLSYLRLRYQILLAALIPLLLVQFTPNEWSVWPMGFISGFGIACALETRLIMFDRPYNKLHGLLRYISAISLGLILYFILSYIFPGEGSQSFLIFLYAKFIILGLWTGAGAPWMFKKLKI